MRAKALARCLYARIPGLAAIRFSAKDAAAGHFPKPEFRGVSQIPVGSGLIVDIGSNRGQSIEAFRRFAPEASVVAFEPEPTSFARLQLRYRRQSKVRLCGCALGSSAGSLSFFVPRYGWWNCDGMAATSYKEATEWLQDPTRMLFFDSSKLSVQEHPIECRTLDSFALNPRILKIHAQGAEFDILNGSKNTIEEHAPAIMAAFPTRAVVGFLESRGYRPYDFQTGRFLLGLASPPRTFTWYLRDQHLAPSAT